MAPEARALDHRPVIDHGVKDGSEILVRTSSELSNYNAGIGALNIQIELLIILGLGQQDPML